MHFRNLIAACAASLLAVSGGAWAQAYPNKPVPKVVAPGAKGTTTRTGMLG